MAKNKHHNGESTVEKSAVVKSVQAVKAQPSDLTKDTEGSETVTLNLQPYLTPLAIIVNAVIIAVAILLAGRGILGTNPSVTNPGTTAVPTQAAEDPNGQPAKTDIKDAPYLGNKDAVKVAVVEFSDYECPFCKRHHDQVYPQLKKDYIDTGKIIYAFKNFIAVPSHNPAATTEAYAALCVRELTSGSNQKYFDYHSLLYTNTQTNGAGLLNTDLYKLGGQLGVDAAALKTCVESNKYADLMKRDESDATAAGVQGTPGFVVGVLNKDGNVDGKLIAGAYPYSEFQMRIDEMLAK